MFPHYIEVSQYRLCFYRIPLWICYDIVCVTPHVRVFLHPSTYAHKHIPKLRRQRTPTQAFPRVLNLYGSFISDEKKVNFQEFHV